jgi:hypothetical protein
MCSLRGAPVYLAEGGIAGVVVDGSHGTFVIDTVDGEVSAVREDFEVLTPLDAKDFDLPCRYVEDANSNSFLNCNGDIPPHPVFRVRFFPLGMNEVPCGFCPRCGTLFYGPYRLGTLM